MVPRNEALHILNRPGFIVDQDTPSLIVPTAEKPQPEQPVQYTGEYPRVYIDCENPAGGLRTHIENIFNFAHVQFASSPATADIRHWHYGGLYEGAELVTCHGYYTDKFWKPNQEPAKEINELLYRRMSEARNVISVSKWVAEGIKAKWGISSTVIPNCLDIMQYNLETYAGFALWIGYNCPEKNPKDLFKIAKKLPHIKFVCVVNDAETFPQLPNVEVIPHPQPHSVIKRLLAQCTFFLSTSLQESFGITALEAMASHKPVVGYDIFEFVNKENGFVAKVGDVDTLTQLCDMVSDPDLIGEKAYQTALRYDSRVVIPLIEKIYYSDYLSDITVVILAHNHKDTLLRAIQSIPQGAKIIVGDTDGTHKAIVPSYCHYMRLPNTNLPNNWNRCIKEANTKYIAILDGDDYRLPGTLEYQIRFLRGNPEIAATCGACYRDCVNKLLWFEQLHREMSASEWGNGNPIAHSSIVFKKSSWGKVSGYDESVTYGEDYDFTWRLIKNRHRIVKLPIIAYHWTYRENSHESQHRQNQDRINAIKKEAIRADSISYQS